MSIDLLRRRLMAARFEEIPPSNQIWYYPSNGKLATLYASSAFLGNVLKHELIGKKGVITFDMELTESTDVLRKNKYISAILLPDSITKITAYGFQGMSKNNLELRLPAYLERIETYGLANSNLLYSFPESLTYIGYLACSSNYSIREIFIPKNVTTMQTGSGGTECRVFDNCINLSKIEVDKDNQYFYSENNCLIRKSNKRLIAVPSISEVFVPEGVKLIGYGSASMGVVNPKTIHLPSTLIEVQNHAFLSANSVKTIIFNSITPPKFYNNSFYYTTPTTIYVPNDSVEAYQNAENLTKFASKIKPLSELPS